MIDPPSIALAQDGTPEVSYSSDANTINVARFDGAAWSTQLTFAANSFGLTALRFAALAIDPTGVAKIMLVTESDTLYYALQQGNTWAVTDLGGGVQLQHVSLGLDSVGLPHIALWIALAGNRQLYGALTLPDLIDQWQSLTPRMVSGNTVLSGKLLVSNVGTAPAARFAVNYYLSSDNKLDSGDTLLGHARLAVGTGQHKVVIFNSSHSGSLSGEYLIAAVSPPNPQSEANLDNNVAVISIP